MLCSASAVPIWLVWFGFVHFGGCFQGVVLRIKTKRYSEAFAANLTPKRHQTNVVEECYTVSLSIDVLCRVDFDAPLVTRLAVENPGNLACRGPSMSMSMTGRTVSKIVPATQGKITRLIGTVDIDGNGTKHPLDQVDPFMLLDAGTLSKHAMPPFGAHPHRGHSVVTVLVMGFLHSERHHHQRTSQLLGGCRIGCVP